MENTYAGVVARKMKPTKKHRIALIPDMLGTVIAVNAAGETRYFDHDWDGAAIWAGIEQGSDLRVAKPDPHFAWNVDGIKVNGLKLLWMVD